MKNMATRFSVVTLMSIMLIPALSSAFTPIRTDRIVIHFFGSHECIACKIATNGYVNPAIESHKGKVIAIFHDISDPDEVALQVAMEKSYGVNQPTPLELFIGPKCLGGLDGISASLDKTIDTMIKVPQSWSIDASSLPKSVKEISLKRQCVVSHLSIADSFITKQAKAEAASDVMQRNGHSKIAELECERLEGSSFGEMIRFGIADGLNIVCLIISMIISMVVLFKPDSHFVKTSSIAGLIILSMSIAYSTGRCPGGAIALIHSHQFMTDGLIRLGSYCLAAAIMPLIPLCIVTIIGRSSFLKQ